jgi:hypothetical protein
MSTVSDSVAYAADWTKNTATAASATTASNDGVTGTTSSGNVDVTRNTDTTPAPFTSNHNTALTVDINVLHTLLQRNHSSHSRTLYYRRTKMALNHIQNVCVVSTLHHDWNRYYTQTLLPIQCQLQRMTSSPKRQQQLYHNTIRVTQKGIHPQSSMRQNGNDSHQLLLVKINEVQEQIVQALINELSPNQSIVSDTSTSSSARRNVPKDVLLLYHRLTTGITNGIERIEYAAQSCYIELSRGFFLPIITIMIAALSRIYVLLLRLQYTIVDQLVQYLSSISRDLKLILPQLSLLSSALPNTTSIGSKDVTINHISQLQERLRYLQKDCLLPMMYKIEKKLHIPRPPSNPSRIQRTDATLQSIGLSLLLCHSQQNNSNSTSSATTNVRTSHGDTSHEHRNDKSESTETSKRSLRQGDHMTFESAAMLSINGSMPDANCTVGIDDDDDDDDTEYDASASKITSTTKHDATGTRSKFEQRQKYQDDDIGQNYHGDYPFTATDLSVRIRQGHIAGPDDLSLDQNVCAVQQYKLQRQQQQQQQGKGRKRSKTTPSDLDNRTTIPETKKSKKLKRSKNEKRSSCDFLDELFG